MIWRYSSSLIKKEAFPVIDKEVLLVIDKEALPVIEKEVLLVINKEALPSFISRHSPSFLRILLSEIGDETQYSHGVWYKRTYSKNYSYIATKTFLHC